MTDFFTDIDDSSNFQSVLAKAKQALDRKASREAHASTNAPVRPTRAPKSASVPLATTTPPERSQRVLGLPGSDKPTAVATPKTSSIPTAPSAPSRPSRLGERTTETFYGTDGGRKYLKDSDTKILELMNDCEYLTTRHLTLAADSTDNYYPRRLRQLEALSMIEKSNDALGHPVWRLLRRGHDYINAELTPVKKKPYGSDHYKREVINTLIVKLSKGVDEGILYPKSEGYDLEPLPIVTNRWSIQSANELVKHGVNPDHAKERDMVRLINDPTHPQESAWKSQTEIRKGGLPEEGKAMLSLYKRLGTAHVLACFDDDGKPDVETSADFVILRPMVPGTVRADGRIENYVFNHDACRVETERFNRDYYRYMVHALFYSGMFGRLHIFTDREAIEWDIKDAWDSLIDDGNLPRFVDTQGHQVRAGNPESWLQFHALPEPVNNMGKGIDQWDEDQVRRARSKYDG